MTWWFNYVFDSNRWLCIFLVTLCMQMWDKRHIFSRENHVTCQWPESCETVNTVKNITPQHHNSDWRTPPQGRLHLNCLLALETHLITFPLITLLIMWLYRTHKLRCFTGNLNSLKFFTFESSLLKIINSGQRPTKKKERK